MIQTLKVEHNVLIQKFEILKMASRMAFNLASKTYLTNILDKKNIYFYFDGCLEAK